MKGVWEGTSSTPCAHLGATTQRKALAGLACRTNSLLSARAPPARQPALQPALTPKSTYAAQNRLPRMGHGSTVFILSECTKAGNKLSCHHYHGATRDLLGKLLLTADVPGFR